MQIGNRKVAQNGRLDSSFEPNNNVQSQKITFIPDIVCYEFLPKETGSEKLQVLLRQIGTGVVNTRDHKSGDVRRNDTIPISSNLGAKILSPGTDLM